MVKKAMILLITITFFGCEAMFTSNLLSTFDQPNLTNLDQQSASDLVDNFMGDDSFYDALSDSQVADVLATLEEALDAGGTEGQEAGIMASELVLASSGAEDTMQNVNDLVTEVAGGDTSSLDTISSASDLIMTLFPPGATEAEIADQLAGMITSAQLLNNVGLIGGTVPGSTDPEEVGSNALFCSMVAIMAGSDLVNDDAATIAADAATLANALVNDTATAGTFDPDAAPTGDADGSITATEVIDEVSTTAGAGLAAVIQNSSIDETLESMFAMF